MFEPDYPQQLSLPIVSEVELLIERLASEAHAEIKAMAESARRSIGQMSRLDHFHRRVARMVNPRPPRLFKRGQRVRDSLLLRHGKHVFIQLGDLTHVARPMTTGA